MLVNVHDKFVTPFLILLLINFVLYEDWEKIVKHTDYILGYRNKTADTSNTFFNYLVDSNQGDTV